MNVYKVIFYYIAIVVVCIVFVRMLYELVTKKYRMRLNSDYVKKNPKIQYFQTTFWILGVIFSGICAFTIGVAGLKDLPFVLKNEYPHVMGRVVEVDKTSHGDYSVIIEDEITKEEVDIGFVHKILRKGEKVEVYYLPHLKFGSVYKIQK